ncbi:uncharacterized protein si:dkey-10c21.1 isoform X1 [Triplophysa rosa]|uniref:CARD domain-containing protein n=1 Tax=Triplophysa rosa TaxID=992332 RepID=A0A9W7WUH5_TRIRA|nr:uncharacterized protein si:dkey-10c21.1 isoform X1 [Triplophysa rosa]KAI7808757.1 hypothetical protein IRJ41_013489 [Triplophysa rosa]
MDKIVLKNKPKLIDWLSGDHIGILQHVQSREFITDAEYDMLKYISVPRKQVIELMDIILGKGEKVCREFLKMLKEDDVNEFSPQLRDWIKTVNNSDTTDNAAQTTPRAQVTSQKNKDCEGGASDNRPIDCEEFLKKKMSPLVQGVKHIDLIVDDLGLHPESVANIRAQATDQNKMRKLLDYINSKTIAERLVDALFRHESDLMNDLLR